MDRAREYFEKHLNYENIMTILGAGLTVGGYILDDPIMVTLGVGSFLGANIAHDSDEIKKDIGGLNKKLSELEKKVDNN